MAKIIVFDKFIGYNVGGAQKSLLTLIKESDLDIKFLGCKVKKGFSAEGLKQDLEVERISIMEIPRFPYLEYALNKKRVENFIKKQKGDILISQSLWASLALNTFGGKKIYFIRDEYNLGEINNYFKGVKKVLKKIYIYIQLPFIKIFQKDNKKAIKNSVVVSNSEFMRDKIKEKFNKSSEVIYPPVYKKEIQKRGDYIIFIGDSFIKGEPIFHQIAKSMPKEKFLKVGRGYNLKKQENILYHPWGDIKNIFEKGKLLIIPSVWEEAFGRLALEAIYAGLPVVASKRGGLAEIVREDFLVSDIWDIGEWREKIKQALKNYKTKQSLDKFDIEKQVEKFKKIIYENSFSG